MADGLNKAADAVAGGAKSILSGAKGLLSWKWAAIIGLGVVASAVAAPAAVAAAAAAPASGTGIMASAAHIGNIGVAAVKEGAPVLIKGAWAKATSAFAAVQTGIGAAVADPNAVATVADAAKEVISPIAP